jgi:hypothetical protein
MLKSCLACCLLAVGCGSVVANPESPDGDDDIEAPDAPGAPDTPDPPEPIAPRPGRDLAVAAGRMSGGGWTVEVQLGATDQTASSGGAARMTSAHPLNP